MTDKDQLQRTDVQRGYQPQPVGQEGLGYQPVAGGPVNPADLKPPKGGTAIEPPQQSSQQPRDQD